MSRIVSPVVACFKKGEPKDHVGESKKSDTHDEVHLGTAVNVGLMSRMSSGLYNVGAGAVGLGLGGVKGVVGLGVGGVKWAASATYTVGSQALGTGSKVLLRTKTKTKDKNE